MTECYCDSSEFYRARMRKARKLYVCCECANVIFPGDRYEDHFGVQDGDIFADRTCSPCVRLRNWVRSNVPCLCITHGNQFEENEIAIEEARFRAPEETVGLYFGYLIRKAANERASKSRHEAR